MRRRVMVLVPLVLSACLTACATTGHELRGESGPITWEIRDVRQSLEQHGSRMRWEYAILLHNRGAVPVIFERMDLGLQSADNQQNVYGGIDSRAFVRHIDPNGDLRVPRSDSWGCPRCGPGELPQVFRQGIIRWITFTGQDMQKVPVKVEVRIRLNSGVGTRQ